MGWMKSTKQNLPDNTKVRLYTLEGVVDAHNYGTPPGNVAVLFQGTDYVSYVWWSALEVFEPDPPVKEYRETSYYRDTQTGTLYYISGSDAISITHISASISTTTILANPMRYKRLYMEH